VLSPREEAADCDHIHITDSFAENGESVVPDFGVRHQMVWSDELAGIYVVLRNELARGPLRALPFEDIVQAHEWLALSYRCDAEVCIFGFSRSAFTAMGLAGLLAWRGLPREYVPNHISNKRLGLYRRATH